MELTLVTWEISSFKIKHSGDGREYTAVIGGKNLSKAMK